MEKLPHILTVNDAFEHSAYDDAIRKAADRAYRSPGDCFSVWYDGQAVYVRASEAMRPPNSILVCIAQQWDDKTVQLRFTGARSEWINFS